MDKLKMNNRGVVSLIGLLITLVIVAFLMYRVSRTYFITKMNSRPEDRKALAGEGISAKSPIETIDIAQQRADEANRKTKALENSVNNLGQ